MAVSLPDVRHCSKLSLYSISKKTYDPNSRKWQKSSFYTWFGHVDPKRGLPIFFLKSVASPVTRYNGQLSSCLISEKTNDPILRKVNDRWTDGWTDGRADRQEQFHRTLSKSCWASIKQKWNTRMTFKRNPVCGNYKLTTTIF